MFKSAMLGLACFAAASSYSEPLPPAPPGTAWKLIWSDEFDSDSIDLRKWNLQSQTTRGRGRWSSDMVSIRDGKLRFEIHPVDGILVSAGVDTYRKFENAFGLYVFRTTLGKVPGHRPALWITSEGVKKVGNEGRDGTEIDVMEQPSRDGHVYLNLHWDGYGVDHRTTGKRVKLPAIKDWYVFALDWSPSRYRFYIDGQLVWSTIAGGVSQEPEFIRMGIEMPESEKHPEDRYEDLRQAGGDAFEVDYVRVYTPYRRR